MDEEDVWLVLTDVREEQPDERLQTDGGMDYNFMALLGSRDSLLVMVQNGNNPDMDGQWEERMVSMAFSRDQAVQLGEALVDWAETGVWSRNPPVETKDLPSLGEGDFQL